MKFDLQALAAKLGGRSTSFFVAFFVVGNVLHWVGKLDNTYIAYMTALLGFIVGHSIKEDHFAEKAQDQEKG